jgi:16S rRNA (adenine1518-N6/adenine1519-N6)-dimethyltransferase
MQKLGQHFLKNAVIIEGIVGALAIADGDRIIEIGPGHGELTLPLARAARGRRCEIVCIEKDRALIENLEALAAKENSNGGNRVTIIEGDVLKLLPEIAAGAKTGSTSAGRYKIVGNIPYYITGKLLRIISELEEKPARTVLLMQKEVAERMCAAPPEMNRLAASVQFWADVAIMATVPRRDFFPPPEVDSAVIVLDDKHARRGAVGATPSIDPALYYRAVRAIFAQPRKTLLNNLSSSAGGNGEKGNIVGQLKKIGIDPGSRPQDLGIAQIIALAEAPLWG